MDLSALYHSTQWLDVCQAKPECPAVVSTPTMTARCIQIVNVVLCYVSQEWLTNLHLKKFGQEKRTLKISDPTKNPTKNPWFLWFLAQLHRFRFWSLASSDCSGCIAEEECACKVPWVTKPPKGWSKDWVLSSFDTMTTVHNSNQQ